MDEHQQQAVLKSIAVSTTYSPNVAPQDRQLAFQVLEQFKAYDGRIPACIAWLHQERHVWENVDITVATKLYVLSILQTFLVKGYATLQEADRLALRHAVLTAARQLAPLPSLEENRILGNKLASLLAGLMVRDFPQRWTSFFQDVFVPIRMGGLWYDGEENMHTMGVLICLECLKLVTEDCTDSDFNSKISTTRRNDVLIGLNEVSSQFVPLLFAVLEHIAVLTQSKNTLHNMRTFLISNGRTLPQMTPEEGSMYQQEMERKNQSARLISECLVTLERFCYSMPLDWTVGKELDFVAAFMHLLREPSAGIQIKSAACLEQLAQRKLDVQTWRKLISQLPQAVGEANAVAQADVNESRVEAAANGTADETPDTLTVQLEFHRGLSRMLSLMISAHLANLSTNKRIMSGSGPEFESVKSFLRLLADMLHHPSGRIAGEQLNMWIALLKDPHNARSGILTPFAGELLTCYMDKMVRVRWEDVEEQTHPQSLILGASWDDEDEYETWMGDIRSKTSPLFKFLGNVEPGQVTSVLNSRIQEILSKYGSGQPGDHIDPSNNQLTTQSEACLQFEALHQPIENVLNGLPAWALEDDKQQNGGYDNRASTRTLVRSNISQMANAIVAWSPSFLWLKFRRAAMLDSLKTYWKYDPSTLLPAIESLFGYLNSPDEWRLPSTSENGEESGLSGEITGLRKKSGVALVSISKKVPHHLVGWLTQLSEAANALLSSHRLLPMTEMHLYEFLSCVATAVDDPVARSNFVANVLANSLSTLESPEMTQSMSSVENLEATIGITNDSDLQVRVADPSNVKVVTDKYCRLFSSVNQLLSVGKRCHEAARRQYKNFVPLQDLDVAVADLKPAHFPDEGPVSLRDLAVNDPFAPLAPRIFPIVTQILDVTLEIWHPANQVILLQNPIKRYALAISDDEAYLSQKHDSNKNGGVFGEGGTAGSVVAGVDRRSQNLVPRWSGWLNELRNTCFQLLGLFAGERVLYAPELAGFFPKFVSVVTNPVHLRSMEHRHMNQFLKQFIEILMLSCPAPLYASHLSPILEPVMEQMKQRLQMTWTPIINPASAPPIPDLGKAVTSATCSAAVMLASRGGEEWYASYCARSSIFVGDLDNVTAESVVEKYRIELTRTYSDMLQAVLGLKGDWALVLATQAKEEQAARRNDSSKLMSGPSNQPEIGGRKNADGTPRDEKRIAVDARKSLRISALCHFLFLEDESLAGSITLSIIQCLDIPDAYTCRRCTRLCHRILETVAWSPRYTPLLAKQMFLVAVKNIVTEPKWMVGLEWDVINLVRDIYCRLVLGQILMPGGQGPGIQQLKDPLNPLQFEQAKTADRPLQGGGILVAPSDIPRQILAGLPGLDEISVRDLEEKMNTKRSAKDQKDVMRDLLRIAAENSAEMDSGRGTGMFDRAVKEESLLNEKVKKVAIPDIPEKLVTQSMVNRREVKQEQAPEGFGANLFS